MAAANPYRDYRVPLQQVWNWNREATPQSIRKAEKKTRELKQFFPLALQIRYELALSLVKQRRRSEAIVELEEAGRDFSFIDEDTLCLWARCYKDDGDERLQALRLVEAEHYYGQAQEIYQRAYDSRGDRFPGINVAALCLVRAALRHEFSTQLVDQVEAGRKTGELLLQQSRETAAQLLKDRAQWKKRLQDDHIWIFATAGEAYLILGDWRSAADQYRLALSKTNKPAPFHFESMERQVARVVDAQKRLGQEPQPPFDDPAAFFSECRVLNQPKPP